MNLVEAERIKNEKFELILVGSGFASLFFLEAYLRLHASPQSRILVIERGLLRPHGWQLQNRGALQQEAQTTFDNQTPSKEWIYTPAIGGGSNCWWGCTPRMLPNDFRLKSLYGVGEDWPVSYGDLEEHYCRVEEIMQISGPDNTALFPRSRAYPQPPHIFSEPDKILKRHYPTLFFEQPSARARVATKNRPPCCASGVCGLCPIDAKFTILNEMSELLSDPRVSMLAGTEVTALEYRENVTTGARCRTAGQEFTIAGEIVALGANSLFNPAILHRSGLEHPALGVGLNEQVSVMFTVHLGGVDSFGGSTSITGHGYMRYDGQHRRERAGALVEVWNVPTLRLEKGRYRQKLQVKFIYENFRNLYNRVLVEREKPKTEYISHAPHTLSGLAAAKVDLEKSLIPLKIESVVHEEASKTEGHIMGTTVMHRDPEIGIVDAGLKHHRLRNLLVLGSSTFPTAAPANPTLTLCALSQYAASKL
ncbi:MAG: GMC family oxidoreductase [Oligoflexia bacterium]|nr:GMC family oxidoreductase [Oligoflexia bacterium]